MRLTDGSDHVRNNVVLVTLLGQSLSESHLGQFGSGVIGLSEVSEKTGSRSSIDDTSILLLPKVRPSRSCTLNVSQLR